VTTLNTPGPATVGEPELLEPKELIGRPFSVRNTIIKWLAGMAVLTLISFAIGGNSYYVNVWTNGLLFAGLALAWNIIGGFGGQFSLGHAVFFGVGAYSTVLLSNLGWGAWPPIIVGLVIAGLLAWGMAAPLFRLRGHFFSIATLALTVVAGALANYFVFTGGPQGAHLPFDSFILQNPDSYVWLMLGYVGLVAVVATWIKHTRMGYSLFAVRDDQDAAQSVGINPLSVKTQGFIISAALTGLGGGLFVQFVTFIDPGTAFDVEQIGIRLPLLALIGGIGTIYGPIIGALIMEPGADLLKGQFGGQIPGLDLIIFSAILILAALFFRRGIAGFVQRADVLIRRRWAKRGR
jgi:branched-chain amino acid transport system permease protein